jgi:hypothetical protein
VRFIIWNELLTWCGALWCMLLSADVVSWMATLMVVSSRGIATKHIMREGGVSIFYCWVHTCEYHYRLHYIDSS